MNHGYVGLTASLKSLFRRCLAFILDIEVCLIVLSFFCSLILRRSRPVQKFIVFGQGRTGGTLLVDLLNSHYKIHCEGEILDRRRRFFPIFFLVAKSVRLRGIGIYGFRLKINHLMDTQGVGNVGSFLTSLHHGGWKIIYLKRKNMLRQAVSQVVATCRKISERRLSDPPEEFIIHIDCKEFLRQMKQREFRLKEEERALVNLPHLALFYEDHFLKSESHQSALDRIFEYLGIPGVSVKTDHVKVTPEKLSDFIENYDEFIKVVKDAGYARFLEEDLEQDIIKKS